MTVAEANYPFDVGLKRIIRRKGIKQRYLAEKMGCSEQVLCDIMAGRRLIKACEIPRFAQALGVTIDEIYGNNQKETNPKECESASNTNYV